MCFAPSFLPSRAGAVTRITKSKRDRLHSLHLAGGSTYGGTGDESRDGDPRAAGDMSPVSASHGTGTHPPEGHGIHTQHHACDDYYMVHWHKPILQDGTGPRVGIPLWRPPSRRTARRENLPVGAEPPTAHRSPIKRFSASGRVGIKFKTAQCPARQ